MNTDHIEAIEINEQGELYIKPSTKQFVLIWRSATQVHWSERWNYLYSPKPREWSYLDWYKQILTVIANEYNYKLILTDTTLWQSISTTLRCESRNSIQHLLTLYKHLN
jgi:hypothetical protein